MRGVAWGLCRGWGEGLSVEMVVAPERSWVRGGWGAEPRSEREAGGDGDVVGVGGGVRGWGRPNARGDGGWAGVGGVGGRITVTKPNCP